MTKFIRLPKPIDPLQSEIDRRLAARKAKERREAIPALPVGPEALRVAAAYLRANPVTVLIMEAR